MTSHLLWVGDLSLSALSSPGLFRRATPALAVWRCLGCCVLPLLLSPLWFTRVAYGSVRRGGAVGIWCLHFKCSQFRGTRAWQEPDDISCPELNAHACGFPRDSSQCIYSSVFFFFEPISLSFLTQEWQKLMGFDVFRKSKGFTHVEMFYFCYPCTVANIWLSLSLSIHH